MFMRLIFLFVFFVLCAGDIKDETEDRLLKFRDDINQISLDFENFIYDIVKESLSSTDMLVNGNSDPNVRANAILKALTPTGRNVLGKKSTDFKEILHKYANSDILPTTQKSIVDNVLDNYREKAANLLSRNGLKRTRRDAVIPGIVNTRYFNTNNDKSDECSKRIQQEKILEHQHIEDLKEEVKKLHDLVILLKDQQKIMTLLDDQSAQDFQPSEMFKTLENDKKNETENDRRNDMIPGIKPTAEELKPSHEELEKMKYDIKQTILALNNTREILINERDRELDLEKELKRQKLELKLLKLMVEKLYQNNTFFEYPPVNNGSTQEDIVGAPIHHPKVIPKIQNKNTTRYSTSFNFRRRNEGLSPRANELDDLLKELDKKNREENIKKLLVKLLEDKESKTLETKNEDTELIKKLQKVLETMNRPQSKIDGDVESELKKLENAINTLKPKDPLDLEDSAEDLVKLKDLINGMSAKDLPNAGGSSNRGLTQQQINELRRRLQQVSTSNAAGNMFPSNGGDFGFGMQHSDIGKKGFTWNKLPPYSEAFGNYPPSLDPYRPTSYGNFYGLQPNGYGYTFPQAPPPNPYPAEGYGPFGISHQYQPSYGGPIYGGNTDNLSYGTKPYGQPFEGYPSYGSNSVPADYNKQFEVNSYGASQKPLPYAQAGSGSLGYTPTDTGGQFFQSGQSYTYDKTVPSAIYAPDNPDGNHPGQPAAHLSKNTHGVDYKAKNIEELKTQISSLQNIINSLNYSGYVKKPEDQETIAGLEQQINELKGIINSLSQDNPPSLPSYNPNPPNTPSYIQPGPSYSRNSPGYNQNQPNLNTRRKRSLDESIYNTSSQVVDQVVSKWKDYLFQEEKPEEKITYKNVQARINNLKAQPSGLS